MQAVQKRGSFDDGFPAQQTVGSRPVVERMEDVRLKDKGRTGLFRILVIEDDLFLQDFYSRVLVDMNFSMDMSSDGHDALEKLSSEFYDLVITDLNLPGMDGIALLHWIKLHRPATTAVVISGDRSADRILAAMREGAKDYLVKPIALAEFREMLDRWSQTQRHNNNEVFSSMLKQVMHDVHSEVLNLEIMIKLLQRGKFDKVENGVGGALHTIQAKLEHMKMLTMEYCLLARNLQQRGGEIQTERLKLKDVIAPVLEEMQDAMQRKEVGLSFRHDLSDDDDAYVQGNRVMLKCVFRTLFSNAIKYCKEASVITYGISTNDRRYKIHVANEGEVVPVHRQATIFDEFVQAQAGDSAYQVNGLGLGLALAKDILRQHGGDIWYEAMTNGSKFVCTLPLHSAPSAD